MTIDIIEAKPPKSGSLVLCVSDGGQLGPFGIQVD